MKKKSFIAIFLLIVNFGVLSGQTTETFEDEAVDAFTFTDNLQTFDIINYNDEFNIFNCTDCGWNGSEKDDQFIDLSSPEGGSTLGDGTSFSIKTNDGTLITVSRLYLFCSKINLSSHTSGELTITGEKEGNIVYTITKNSGFADVENLTPNNGYTLIDFTTEGGTDYSNIPIDQLTFSSTGNLDYLGLDALTWDYADNPVIGIAKEAIVSSNQVTFNYYIENLGNVTLTELQLEDDLNAVFGTGNYNITTPPSLIDDPGTITLNPEFNGNDNTQLFSTTSQLNSGDTAQIQLVVAVNPIIDMGSGLGVYQTQNTITAKHGEITIIDISDNGNDPDPNGNNNPDEIEENDPTIFTVIQLFCNSTRLFVNSNASVGGDGLSWATAYNTLQEAIIFATICPLVDEIWVAQGTYTPGFLETDSFFIPKGITLLGGFNGTETTASERSWTTNPTILSGDLNGNNTADAGDSHTIVTLLEDNVTLDGFTIQHGYADDETDNSQVAIGRGGAGIYIRNAKNINIKNCIFKNNVAQGNGIDNGVGGAIINFGLVNTATTISNCLFHNNTATAGGGAISGENGIIYIMNCTIADNNASQGGGIHLYSPNIIAANNILSNNSGTNGNINDSGPGTLWSFYNMFFNTTSGNNGNIPPNIVNSGNNIVNTDPLFDEGYQLSSNSPAIDAGSNAAYINNVGDVNNDMDLAGTPRLKGSSIDMGAFEQNSTLGMDAFETSVFNLYPNPVDDVLNIKTSYQEYDYVLYNIQGQEILRASQQSSKIINVSKLPPGIYVLRLSSGNKSQNFKIIKE